MEEEEESYAPASNSASVCDASDCAVPPLSTTTPTFSTIFRTFSYVGNVQLVRRSFRLSLCFTKGEHTHGSMSSSLTTTISLSFFFFFFFWWGSLCLWGLLHRPISVSQTFHQNSLLFVVHRETIFQS